MEQCYRKVTGRHNFNIEENGRPAGRQQSKSNLRVRSLLLEHTISKIPSGLSEMAFFGFRKNKGSMFHYFDSTCQQWNKSLKSLRKIEKEQESMI